MPSSSSFDVFLSYNWKDEPQVRQICLQLEERGLKPWLDKVELGPDPWREEIQKAMAEIKTCLIVVGPHGFGNNQKDEISAAHHLEKKGNYWIVPVLLPGVREIPQEHLFLAKFNRVRFAASLNESEVLDRLASWIKREPASRPDGAFSDAECPYRGLERFDVEHAGLFFGRDELTRVLIERVAGSLAKPGRRFLAIEGASGSGKSSLARAGLLARLKSGAIPSSEQWPQAIIQPGDDPLHRLAVEVGRALGQDTASVLTLKNHLTASDQALKTHLDLHLAGRPRDVRCVVLVDQFEELYTSCKEDSARQIFIDNILGASQGDRAVVAVAVRADFIAKCAAHAELARAMSESAVLVGPMTDIELRDVIERPAVIRHCLFEPGLVDQLVVDVKKQPGNLPLLQFALKELWQKRQGNKLTLEAYHDMGGVQGALERHAERIYAGFTETQKSVWRRLFLRLTNPGEGTEDTRRRVALRDLLPAQAPVEEVTDIVWKLSEWETRLLTVDRPETQGEEFVEVAHEALIRGWSRLRQWIDADRASLVALRRLSEAAAQWNEKGHDPDYLLQGARLAAAEEVVRSHRDDLNALEHHYFAASRAKANQQRRRKRTAVTAAISLLGLLCASLALVILLLVAHFHRERDAQQAVLDARAKIEADLDQAEHHCDRARHVDIELSGRPVDETRVHLVRVNDFLAKNADPDLLGRKEKVDAAIRQIENDRRLVERLAEARLLGTSSNYDRRDSAISAQAFGAAFRDYGIDVEVLDPAETISRLRATPVAPHVAAALDSWATRLDDPSCAERLRRMALEIDCDLRRQQIRRQIIQNNIDEIRKWVDAGLDEDLHPATLGTVAFLLRNHDENERAVRLLKSAWRRDPGDFWINTVLADFFVFGRNGHEEAKEAIPYSFAALAVRKLSPGARLNLARCLVLAGRETEAIPHFEALSIANIHAEHAHVSWGWALNKLQQYEKAIPHFEKALEIDPKYAMAHNNWGWALSGLQQHKEAIPHFEKALEIDPKFAMAHNSWGVALSELQRHKEAISHFEKALEIDPKNAMAHNNWGWTLNELQQYEKAIQHFEKALDIDPKFARAHNNWGWTLNELQQYEKAIPHFEKALEIDPKFATAHNSWGVALSELQRHKEAIPHFEKALEIDPKFATAHNNWGVALSGLQQHKEAIPHFEKALELDPKNSKAHGNWGIALVSMQQYDKAIPHLQKAVELDSKNAIVRTFFGAALNELRQHDKAVPHLQEAVALNPRNVVAYLSLGESHRHLGDFELAARSMIEAATHAPDNLIVLARTYGTCKMAGKFNEALNFAARGKSLSEGNSESEREWQSKVDQCKLAIRLDRDFAKIQQGEIELASDEERTAFARVCQWKKRYVESVRFWDIAFSRNSNLENDVVEGDRYDAACAATLAGSSADSSNKLTADERAKYRQRGYQWLKAHLKGWQAFAAKEPRTADDARSTASWWLDDPDFRFVRGEALKNLPEQEARGWAELWSEIAAFADPRKTKQ